jgi:Lar family restriction alleviation protein
MRPCPFCGSKNLRASHNEEYFFIECALCGAQGPQTLAFGEEDQVVKNNWNQRVEENI